jgi:DNA-binding transcriptional MerR regulator
MIILICYSCPPTPGSQWIKIMEKLYYTIGEVAEILGENTSLVRFWSNSFTKYLKPKRNAKGNRLYTKDDVETLKQIHLLVKEQGMTLDGAAKKMAADRKKVDSKVKVLDSLKEIRKQLVNVKKSL